jgi:hypothetical protein
MSPALFFYVIARSADDGASIDDINGCHAMLLAPNLSTLTPRAA